PAGYWCKKIKGKLYYFGSRFKADDPVEAAAAAAEALDDYNRQADALHAGKKPRESTEGTTVKDIANAFLNCKKALLDAGELSGLTFAKYKTAAKTLVDALGKARLVADLDPDDFARLRDRMAKRWGVYRLGDMIQHLRYVFRHAHEAGLIPTPQRF